jgi:hypothetical protein
MIEKLIKLSNTQKILLYSAMTAYLVQIMFISLYKGVNIYFVIGYLFFMFLSLICYYKIVID